MAQEYTLSAASSRVTPRGWLETASPREHLLALAAFLLFTAGYLMFREMTPVQVLGYAFYHSFYLLLPGLLIVGLFASKGRDFMSAFGIAWLVGFFIALIVFALASALNFRPLFQFYPILFAATLITPQVRLAIRSTLTSPRMPRWELLVILVVACAYLLWSSAMYINMHLPVTGAATVTYEAYILLYNAISGFIGTYGLPLEKLDLAGVPLFYHFFAYADAGMARWVLPIDLMTLARGLTQLWPIGLMLLGAFDLGRTASRKNLGGTLAMVGVFAVGELLWHPGSWLSPDNYFWLITSPSTWLGIGALMITAAEAIRWSNLEGPIRWQQCIVPLLGIGTLLGTKAHMLVSLGGACGIVLVLLLVYERRIRLRLLLFTLASAVVFVVGAFLVYGLTQPSRPVLGFGVVPFGWILGGRSTFFSVWMGQDYTGTLLAGAAPETLRVIAVVLNLILMLGSGIVLLPALFWLRRFRITLEEAWVLAIFLVALVGGLVFYLAQDYYVFIVPTHQLILGVLNAIAFTAVLAYWQRGLIWKVVTIASIGLMAIGFIDNLSDRWDTSRPIYTRNDPGVITVDLIATSAWVREHVPLNSRMIHNRELMTTGELDLSITYPMAYAPMTERQFLIVAYNYTPDYLYSFYEGRGYDNPYGIAYPERVVLQNCMLKNDSVSLWQGYQEFGITHALVDLEHGSAVELPESNRVYENDSFAVYALPFPETQPAESECQSREYERLLAEAAARSVSGS